jgi:hypothetical protein
MSGPDRPPDGVDPALRSAVREIEAHAAEAGWDQPARLFALVPTADLVAREPQLASRLGIADGGDGSLTPVEQDGVPPDTALESVLQQVVWPAEVLGCAAVVERLVLPPSADADVPDDPGQAQRYAAEHPDREDVRMVAAATRTGSTYCVLRLRTHDDPRSVVEAPDLVPALLELLRSTLEN